MADSKISALPAASALTTAELLAIVQASTSVQTTIAALLRSMLTKFFINNNASATYNVTATTLNTVVCFGGTNVASLTFNFPAASAAIDGFRISLSTVAAVGTVAFASAG